jgi:hypothetical protein
LALINDRARHRLENDNQSPAAAPAIQYRQPGKEDGSRWNIEYDDIKKNFLNPPVEAGFIHLAIMILS